MFALGAQQRLNQKFQVPTGRRTIDWSNPLTKDLIGAFAGDSLGNLVNGDVQLSFFSGGFFGVSPEGHGIKSTGASNGGAAGIASAAFYSYTNRTIYIRHFSTNYAGGNGGTPYAAVSYTSPPANPFWVSGIDTGADGAHPRLTWNSGGSSTALTYTPAALVANTVVSLAGVFPVGGTVATYNNGIATGDTASFGVSGPTAIAGSSRVAISALEDNSGYTNSTNLCSYFWNRILTPSEILTVHLDPYAFLAPDEYELPIAFVPAAPTANFRRSLSSLGTRTGSRQVQGG